MSILDAVKRFKSIFWAALSAAIAAMVVLFSAPIQAQSTPSAQPTSEYGQSADFDPESSAWTGLANFVSLIRQQGVELRVVDTLDWSKLDADEVLLVVYSRTPLEVDHVAQFVVQGGQMLLAVESGGHYPVLERLDVRLVAGGGLPHKHFVQANPSLPIFNPRGKHPLLSGVKTLVANHPVVLINQGGPVVSYDAGSGLVYDMNLGEGKVVVAADASLFINQMLKVADNAQFARNVVDYLCADKNPCQATLLVGGFKQIGEFAGENPDAKSSQQDWSRWANQLNDTLSAFMDEVSVSRLFYYLAILLAAGLAVYLAAVFRLRATRRYSEYMGRYRRGMSEPQSEFDWNLERFGRGGRETNYALPLAILKEVFEEMFLRELGFWPLNAGQRPSIAKLGRAFRQKYLSTSQDANRVERQVLALLKSYAGVPTRHRVFLDTDAYYSERDLLNIYRSTRQVLRRMGLQEEYEQRTRSLV